MGTPDDREQSGLFGQKKVYLFMLASRLLFLMISGSESGCLGLGNQLFGVTKLDFQWIQGLILGGLGTNSYDLCCPGDWVKI